VERLTTGDLRRFDGAVRDLYQVVALADFRVHAIRAIRRLIACDTGSYNDIDPAARRMETIVEPHGLVHVPGYLEVLERHIAEHPLVQHQERTADPEANAVSGHVSRRGYRELPIYREFYRLANVEDTLASRLAAGPGARLRALSLNRSSWGFSGREHMLLRLARPHLEQARDNAAALARVEAEVGALRGAVEASRGGIVALDGEGRLAVASARARAWLAAYFGADARTASRLPEAVERWVRAQGAPSRGEPARACAPLVAERPGHRLEIRLVRQDDARYLMLDERATQAEPGRLVPLGLTRREAEVLALVARGSSNGDVARELGISDRTVAKHLERAYRALGVETRTAAAARAMAALGARGAEAP
jgi:DNA-binding CsgD family transcriptional regulator